MSDRNMDWAMLVMRAGYLGRGLTYLAIATLSLWAIWQGGDAQGTSEALQAIDRSRFGNIALLVIGAGLIAYTAWRLLDAAADLEGFGTDARGLIARAGMIITGLLHAVISLVAITLALGGSGDGGGGTGIAGAVARIMALPFGIWLVAAAGAATLGTGIYYLHKAWKQSYLATLQGNHFTTHWRPALRAGVAAQGITVGIIGILILIAAITSDPSEAGGLGESFAWLESQIYGQILVTLLCAGLLGFALFLFVNAAYRIVPKLSDPDVTSLRKLLD